MKLLHDELLFRVLVRVRTSVQVLAEIPTIVILSHGVVRAGGREGSFDQARLRNGLERNVEGPWA